MTAVQPRDAATLILVRRDQGEPQLLMGRRAAGHSFMPVSYTHLTLPTKA
jgi:hypothetical protein